MKGEDTSCPKTEWELPEGQENEVPPAPLMPQAKGRESGKQVVFCGHVIRQERGLERQPQRGAMAGRVWVWRSRVG